MVNESGKQKIYHTLRGQVSARLLRTLNIAEADVANLSLGELINIIFVVHGDGGSTGNFSVSFGAALKMVGVDLMWQEPRRRSLRQWRWCNDETSPTTQSDCNGWHASGCDSCAFAAMNILHVLPKMMPHSCAHVGCPRYEF